MHSHHSHSGQFCTHAQGDLESVINEAIRQKFKIFGLSEHVPRYRDVDLYPGEQPLGGLFHLRQLFSSYLVESHRLRSIYSSQIDIIVGLETELITTRDLDEVESILRIHKDQIEYLVGSVHHANEIPIDFDEPTWRTAVESFQAENESSGVTTPPPGEDLDLDDGKVAAYLTSYFDAQLLLMQRLHPEVIGHFDLCRLYRPGLRLDSSISSDIFSRIERNIDYAISYGALFELNAAAFRKGWATSYPGEDILNVSP
ncbi:histidinolphosphatase [Tulasnella sp. 419]|nr:histidinolphosphatase [Tulasnella sp. 419]